MSTFVFDCPACTARNSTFNVRDYYAINNDLTWNLFSVCRACDNSLIIKANVAIDIIAQISKNPSPTEKDLDNIFEFVIQRLGYDDFHLNDLLDEFQYSPILANAESPPAHLPEEIESIFKEAAKCLSIGCFNAAGAMFRLCLDIVTKKIVEENQLLNPTSNDKKTIHNRLAWIFKNNILPSSLEDLSRCIKDDGNDAAHDGNLIKEDAEDLLDFSFILLERVYTEPYRIVAAEKRRATRRQR
ncbi:DUF4145 domain-containing protein [Acinetobacter pittii]|uniref:DUF4145 domain-containing protein n=1 Tax=Acinetobacter pittii TaxID=48296 RepID=UPI00249F68D6|nr:DUF4145 domain-containing protein [Acinetobacter pittii]WHA54731.1 hypothetical protein OH685_15840 [Acinetobacter pittii]